MAADRIIDDYAGAGSPQAQPGQRRARSLTALLAKPFTNRRSRRRLLSLLCGFLLWELSVVVFDVSSLVVSPPSAIAVRFVELVRLGELQEHLRVSAVQFALGYFGCAALAIPMGLAIGRIEWLRDTFDPWITALYATPSISLAPLFIIWLGFGTTSKAFIIGLLAFFPIIINTIVGVESVTSQYDEVASAFKADRVEQFVKVIFPGALAYIFAGMRLAIGRGLVGLVVADLFGARAGLGYMILRAAQLVRTVDVLVATIVLAVLGVLLTAALGALQRSVCHWQKVDA